MRKRRKVLILTACLAALGAFFIALCRDEEPSYEGRPLHDWIEIFAARRDIRSVESAESAIRHIGTNGIPLLLKWVAYEPTASRIRKAAAATISKVPLAKKIPAIKQWLRSKDSQEFLANAAAEAFAALGPHASSAIPELARLAQGDADPGPARRAVDALTDIGPCSLPALMSVITNRQAAERFYAITALPVFGTNASPAVPLLISCLKESGLASAAAEALGHIEAEPQLVVPALTSMAQDPDPMLRGSALNALGYFGKDAQTAVPTLLAALSDQDSIVRDTATHSLQQIAPEALTNASPP